jgi:predicted membrane protein
MRDYIRAMVALVVWAAAAVILLWAACSTVIKGVGGRW